jgi:endonuclease-3
MELLEEEYGAPARHSSRHDPLSELVMTVLSQNTSDKNSRPAFQSLRAAFPCWEDVARAPVDEVAVAIHSGGLAWIKAERIKLILQQIQRSRGSLDLEFLRDMPLEEAKSWLRGLSGVGPKTAACVLLFSLGRPVLPVDTHVHRVAQRLGLIGSRVSRELAHDILEALVPAEDIYRFHVLLIEHGRRLCRAARPLCPRCSLREDCSYFPAGHRELVASGAIKEQGGILS